MREFDKPIGKVWRRLRLQRFLAALVWCWGICLAMTAVAIAVEKFAQQPIPGPDWVPFAVAGAVGLVVAGLIALLSGPTRVDASVAIDREFHLNERLSTVLTLPPDLRETPAGKALIADAIRKVQDLDVGSRFGLRLPKAAWVPLVPAALAVGLLMVPPDLLSKTQAKMAASKQVEEKIDPKKVTEEAQALKKKLEERAKALMDKTGSPEAEKLLAEIQKAADQIAKSPPADKEKALIELNKFTDALKDRQKQIGSSEQIGKKLQQLTDLANDGPGDKFAKDLSRGDFQNAAEELKQLQEKLMSGKMTAKEKEQLKEQLGKMQEQLKALANMQERKKQLQDALKSGAINKEQFEQQMAKLNDQAQDLEKLNKLAQQLAQAQQKMQQGDMQKAAEALGMSQQQLEEMAKQVQELETLDAALADLQDAKNGMNGDGMNQLGERMAGMNQLGMNRGEGNNGMGLGRGKGQGDRPEAPDVTNAYNTKVKQQYGKGAAILEGFAPPGKQMAGDSVIDVQEALQVAANRAGDALSNQKVPKNVQKHVTGYFDQVRKGN